MAIIAEAMTPVQLTTVEREIGALGPETHWRVLIVQAARICSHAPHRNLICYSGDGICVPKSIQTVDGGRSADAGVISDTDSVNFTASISTEGQREFPRRDCLRYVVARVSVETCRG